MISKILMRFISYLIAVLVLSSCASSTSEDREKPGRESSDQWITEFVDAPKDLDTENIYTFFCESVVQRPTTLTNTCADLGESVFEIRWKQWDLNGAKGSGIYSINQCEPDCATGKRIETPVNLSLDRFTTDGSRFFLNYLTITSNSFESDEIYEIWDLSSFYREVPDLRG